MTSTMGGIRRGALEVTAVRCADVDGFFVSSFRYRELRAAEDVLPSYREEATLLRDQIFEMQVVAHELMNTSSASISLSQHLSRAYADEVNKRLDQEDKFAAELAEARGDRLFWAAIGGAVVAGVGAAIVVMVKAQ